MIWTFVFQLVSPLKADYLVTVIAIYFIHKIMVLTEVLEIEMYFLAEIV